jgi:ribosomal protein S18 acetylase RimI-like enzyme
VPPRESRVIEYEIEEVAAMTQEVVTALARLVPQLTTPDRTPAREFLERLARENQTTLVVARNRADRAIVGTAALVTYLVPTGVRAVIEDVVVDAQHRGHGIGALLVEYLMDAARSRGARGVGLTSNPRRAAANELYLQLGFRRRETNVYFHEFPDAEEFHEE